MATPRENSTSFTRLQPCYLINSQVWHVPPQPKKQKRRNPDPPFEVWFVLTSCKKNRSESSGWVWEVCLTICFFWETSVCFGEILLWNIQFVLWLCGPCWWLLLNTLNVCSFPSSDLVGIWPNVLSPPCLTPLPPFVSLRFCASTWDLSLVSISYITYIW